MLLRVASGFSRHTDLHAVCLHWHEGRQAVAGTIMGHGTYAAAIRRPGEGAACSEVPAYQPPQ